MDRERRSRAGVGRCHCVLTPRHGEALPVLPEFTSLEQLAAKVVRQGNEAVVNAERMLGIFSPAKKPRAGRVCRRRCMADRRPRCQHSQLRMACAVPARGCRCQMGDAGLPLRSWSLCESGRSVAPSAALVTLGNRLLPGRRKQAVCDSRLATRPARHTLASLRTASLVLSEPDYTGALHSTRYH